MNRSRIRTIGSVVEDLKRAAASARASGDISTAEAFERQALLLEHDFALAGSPINGLTFSSASVDIDRVKTRWSALPSVSTYSTDDVCLFNCGERGSVTFVGGAIIFSGRIAMEPIAALLLAEHAREHHRGGGTAFGSPEFLLHVAIANAATASAINVPSVRAHDTEQVRVAAQAWQDVLRQIRSRSAEPPSSGIRRSEHASRPVPA